MAAEAIVVDSLAKRYADGTYAVTDVSFTVAAGEIVGLVGPNGAGKSTTLNMLATLIAPTGGDAYVYGVPVRRRAAVRPLLGVALQATGLDPLMTVADHFAVHGALYRMRSRDVAAKQAELLEVFELGSMRGRRVGDLSGGTQRRLGLALSLLHGPKAIVFDEPTVALDPNLRRTVWELLEDLRAQGLAVLFSTHYMDEADRLCQRIELMAKGRIVVSGTPDELKAAMAGGVLRLRVRDDAGRAEEAVAAAAARGLIGANATVEGQLVEIPSKLGDASLDALAPFLAEFDVEVVDLHWGHGTLDDVFAQLESTTGESQLSPVTKEHRALARRGGRK
ncbi:ABC transporter ATP-binding protein [Actinomadura sp. NEAU-AAG7]|uniref:ABC transporter ATP-binding protein n=1 Tax=Actinomadura sp. NEAU-AAG7 TaxID=2839640 RepID=UPI001BE4D222|nr:ABC transporter ATP-binding protein [Actinomadura sp. NEAU-AAG7]MBT2212874.1 ABC transporter ATP-binding protein [Actinomadura sp. NEAU-AAG7]